MPKERAQQVLGLLYGMNCAAGAASEAMQVRGAIDGVRNGLQPRPEVFEQIEFQGVWRQAVQLCQSRQSAVVEQLVLVSCASGPGGARWGA